MVVEDEVEDETAHIRHHSAHGAKRKQAATKQEAATVHGRFTIAKIMQAVPKLFLPVNVCPWHEGAVSTVSKYFRR